MSNTAYNSSIPAHIEERLVNFALQQKRDGMSDLTITARTKILRNIAKTTDILNPEAVKNCIAKKQTWNDNTRIKAVEAYTRLLEYYEIKWKPPTYKKLDKMPFIPTEEELDILINNAGKRLQAILLCLKETGARIGEITQLKTIDIDTQRKTINITPEKHSNARILPISDKLIGTLQSLPRDPRAKYNTIFQPDKEILRTHLSKLRKTLAQRFNNPRLLHIGFHTIRHWKGTTEYHETKDIMHVKYVLGHKSVTNTQIYINLENALFLHTNEHFTCKIAHNEKEETELIEAGFTLVNNRGELAFYKKRK